MGNEHEDATDGEHREPSDDDALGPGREADARTQQDAGLDGGAAAAEHGAEDERVGTGDDPDDREE